MNGGMRKHLGLSVYFILFLLIGCSPLLEDGYAVERLSTPTQVPPTRIPPRPTLTTPHILTSSLSPLSTPIPVTITVETKEGVNVVELSLGEQKLQFELLDTYSISSARTGEECFYKPDCVLEIRFAPFYSDQLVSDMDDHTFFVSNMGLVISSKNQATMGAEWIDLHSYPLPVGTVGTIGSNVTVTESKLNDWNALFYKNGESVYEFVQEGVVLDLSDEYLAIINFLPLVGPNDRTRAAFDQIIKTIQYP